MCRELAGEHLSRLLSLYTSKFTRRAKRTCAMGTGYKANNNVTILTG
jgi:hypothetical protein